MQPTVLMALVALLLSFSAFATLSVAMERHQEEVLGRTLARTANHGLRAAGTALLTLALAACMVGQTRSVAAVVWLGLLTFAALPVAALLSYSPRILLPASGIALLIAATMALTLL